MSSCFYLKVAVAMLASVIAVVGGYFVHTEIPTYVKKRVKEAFILDTVEASSFSQFVNPSKTANIYYSYYIFNITNKNRMLYHNEKPIVDQLGPYIYLKQSYKELDTLSWNANGTINYRYHDSYEFQADRSSGTENDTVITIDLGFVGLLTQLENVTIPILGPAPDVMLKLLSNYTPIVNVTVYELLWGYKNPILEVIDGIASVLHIPPPVNDVIAIQQQDDPQTWLNYSSAYTGGPAADGLPAPPSGSLLKLTRWAGYDLLDYWGSHYANMINGTDGTSFEPGSLTNGPTVSVFVDSIFRSVYLTSHNSRTYKGVDLISLELPSELLLDRHHNPDNAAFNMRTTGFIPFPASMGKPIHISLPHFLYANFSAPDVNVTYLQNGPASSYDIRLDVEPISGQLFVANKRLQINTYIKPNVNFPNNTVNTYVPIMYVDENFIIPDNLFDEYRHKVQMPIQIGFYGGIALMVAGCVGVVATIVITALCVRKRANRADSDLYDPMN